MEERPAEERNRRLATVVFLTLPLMIALAIALILLAPRDLPPTPYALIGELVTPRATPAADEDRAPQIPTGPRTSYQSQRVEDKETLPAPEFEGMTIDGVRAALPDADILVFESSVHAVSAGSPMVTASWRVVRAETDGYDEDIWLFVTNSYSEEATYGPEWQPEWVNEHPRTVDREGSAFCFRCHGYAFCTYCHVRQADQFTDSP